MSKRFTETMKWNDPWFRKLSTEHKVFWLYICDNCDNAGVWKVDFEAASFFTGTKIDANSLPFFNSDKHRIVEFDQERLWLIKDFIAFQVMDLNSITKKSTLTNLQKNCVTLVAKYIDDKLLTENDFNLLTGKLPVIYSYLTSIGIGKGKGKGKDIEVNTEFEAVWKEYPDKSGKFNAQKAFEKAINSGVSVDTIIAGISRYKAYVASKRKSGFRELNYKNGSTWFNQKCWNDDYIPALDPKADNRSNKI